MSNPQLPAIGQPGNVGAFSPQGLQQFTDRVDEYVDDLSREAFQVARRARADTVSAAHVDLAASRLSNSLSGRLRRHVGTIGGILLGTGLAQFVAMSSAAVFTQTGVLLAAGLGILGAFMVAFHIAGD